MELEAGSGKAARRTGRLNNDRGPARMLTGEKTLADLAQHFDVHVKQITQWRSQLLDGATGVFEQGKPEGTAPAIDRKSLHAKLGELTLENDVLSGALGKAGMLTAKR